MKTSQTSEPTITIDGVTVPLSQAFDECGRAMARAAKAHAAQRVGAELDVIFGPVTPTVTEHARARGRRPRAHAPARTLKKILSHRRVVVDGQTIGQRVAEFLTHTRAGKSDAAIMAAMKITKAGVWTYRSKLKACGLV